jgi:steroid delta-isomerase-like uncharacterized protein
MPKSASVFLFVLVSMVSAGCRCGEVEQRLDLMTAEAAIEAQNKETVLRWFREVNRDNFEQLFAELFAADCQQRMPPNAEPRNPEEFRALVDQFYTAFPKVEHTVGEIVAEGDKVAAIITVHATHEGEFLGIPATGRVLEWTAIAVFTFANGEITARSELYDHATFMDQLGMEFRMKSEME